MLVFLHVGSDIYYFWSALKSGVSEKAKYLQWGLEYGTSSVFGLSVVVRSSPDHLKTELWLA